MDTRLADPLLGRVLDGRYRVEGLVARGGMAAVYLATDTRLDRRVAVKVMHAELATDEDFVHRFIGEAKSVARLSHPNVVAVFDQGSDGRDLYLAMEYVPGWTLRQLLDTRGWLEPREALDLMVPLLSALHAAHRAGIIHRDVKPENVLVARDGQVKVVDFGLARALAASRRTRSGLIMGTAAYLAPEQVSGTGTDARTDVYAAGVVLFELLTGVQPYTGDTPLAVAYQHVNRDVPAPSTVVRGIPPAVDALVARATSRDPQRRPADAGVFLRDVHEVRRSLGVSDVPLAERVETTAPINPAAEGTLVAPVDEWTSPITGLAGTRRRWGRWFGILAVAVVLAAGAGGWWLIRGRDTTVPAVTGMTATAAASLLRSDGFTVAFAPAVPDDTVHKGTVVRTVPQAGGRLPRGATVTLVTSAGPRMITVPSVAGTSPAAARHALQAAGLTPSSQVKQVASASVPAGLVAGTDPAAGVSWPQPRPVVILVSEGPPLPDFVGQPLGAVQAWIQQAGGRLGATLNVRQTTSSTGPAGTVIQQSPAAGTPVGRGEAVTVVVSEGPPNVGIPDVTGMTVQDARAALHRLGFHVRVDRFGPFDMVFAYAPHGVAPQGATVTVFVGL